MIKQIFSYLFLLLISITVTHAEVTREANNKGILIISSDGYSLKNAIFLNSIKEEIQKDFNIPISVYYSNTSNENYFKDKILKINAAINSVKPDPKVILISGEDAWYSYLAVKTEASNLKDIPVVLINCNKLSLLSNYTFEDVSIDKLLNINNNIESNTTLIKTPDVISDISKFIVTLYPKLNDIVYISTNSDYDKAQGIILRQNIQTKYPEKRVTIINENSNDAKQIIKNKDISTSKVYVAYKSDLFRHAKIKDPVFTLEEKTDYSNTLANITFNQKKYLKNIVQTLQDKYNGVKTPALIPSEKAEYVLNKWEAKRLNIYDTSKKISSIDYKDTELDLFFKERVTVYRLILLFLLIVITFIILRNKRVIKKQTNKTFHMYRDLFKEYEVILQHIPIGLVEFDSKGKHIEHSLYSKPLFKKIFSKNPDKENLDLSFFLTEDEIKELDNKKNIIIEKKPNEEDNNNMSYKISAKKFYNSITNEHQYIIIFIDETEKILEDNDMKHNNLLLNFAMDSSKIGIILFNLIDKKYTATKYWLKNLEILDDDSSTIPDFTTNMRQVKKEQLLEFFKEAKKGQKKEFTQRIRIKREDGEAHWILQEFEVIEYNPKENRIIVAGVNSNIDDKAKNEILMINAINSDKSATQLKNKFISNMSHEIKNPINSIINFSELMFTKEGWDQKEQLFKSIEENNNTLIHILQDIVDKSKIESGAMGFNKSVFDLHEVMNNLFHTYKLQTKKGVSLTFRQYKTPCLVETDRDRLKQAITNLLTNAIKFTDKGFIEMGFNVRGKNVYIIVKDTGRGMNKILQRKLFNRREYSNSNSNSYGLGLSITKSIVEKMNGRIEAISELGRGSVFICELPILKENSTL